MNKERLGETDYIDKLKRLVSDYDELSKSNNVLLTQTGINAIAKVIEQAERVDSLVKQINEFIDEDIKIEDSLFAFVDRHLEELKIKWENKPYSDSDHKNSVMLSEVLNEVGSDLNKNKRYREFVIDVINSEENLEEKAYKLLKELK